MLARELSEHHATWVDRIVRQVGSEGRWQPFVGPGPAEEYLDGVRAVEEARGAKRTEWLGRHGDWGKWLVLSLARRCTGMTLADLGRQMGAMQGAGRTMDYAAVSAGLRWSNAKRRQDPSWQSRNARADS